MIQLIVNQPQSSGLGDTLFVTTTKINDNFTELYTTIQTIQDDLDTYDISTLTENLNGIIQIVGDLEIAVNQSLTTLNNNILSINNSIAAQNVVIADLQNIINNL